MKLNFINNIYFIYYLYSFKIELKYNKNLFKLEIKFQFF